MRPSDWDAVLMQRDREREGRLARGALDTVQSKEGSERP